MARLQHRARKPMLRRLLDCILKICQTCGALKPSDPAHSIAADRSGDGEVTSWFFIVAGLLACGGTGNAASCPVVMNPPAVVVEYNGNITVSCWLLAEDAIGMGWESTAGGTGLMKNIDKVTLQIKSVVDWALSPRCYVKMADGSQCDVVLPVTVYKSMHSVSLHMFQSSPMLEDNHYSVRCEITSVAPARNLTVYLHKGNKLLQAEPILESNPRPVHKVSVMNVAVDRNDDGAQIWCEAKLTFPQVGLYLPAVRSGSQRLSVEYPPTFIHPENETLEVAARSKLHLNCTAEGKPPPDYTWRDLQSGQNLNEKGSTLAPSFHLQGTYSCTASNIHGIRTKYFTIRETAGNHPTMLVVIIVITIIVVRALLGSGLAICIFCQRRGHFQPTPSGIV
ncbi:cell adhesion molecule 3-like [Betta splendens]|uniref:Cell adhesion molecule 3-like n=1 Tax=Betta splendens TaxID=158456 RepID=A0A6P7MJV2_BETSP|nr:cell adhesion molecule 3-like [Betta splendens]